MELGLETMAAAIGVSVPVLRFLLCFVATIPVSFLWRFVPGTLPKHVYSAFSGVVLSYLSFGISSNLLFLVPMLLGYAAMLLYRPKCGIITFFLSFGYLIGCHVYYMSGDAWKEGGIDATGALMVLTLKVISSAINYNDGLLKEEDLREAQKRYRLVKLPSLIEYFGYCLCCGSHFAGPVFEMKDYLEWTEGKGIWAPSDKGLSPSPYGATFRALVQAGISMAVYLYLVPYHPLSWFSEPVYQEWGFWRKLSFQYMSGFTARWKYYFIWSISEASIIISGLGFSGWTESSPPKPKWDRAKNVDIPGVELAKSAVVLPLVWNIQVSTWLRHYVYERLITKGKKPGFFQLLATQTGLYPGYMLFFVQSALMIAGSRVFYRWEQATNMGLVKKALVFINFAYTLLILNYSAVGFLVLSLHESLALYGSVYYVGTILPITLILLGYIIPAKPARSKARKQQ
ncbi:hypothetical protein ES332_D02G135300v1 [Gossypium tomentosum]|uniref:Uncharacterized protein n=1 Tax=Gossypium tomentosum TaxID=34277 RepID=A0A5D2LWQ8_GOSTO|nr:hypothetical protein ES332_D02G135300v1 [Gossypium tomentosum]